MGVVQRGRWQQHREGGGGGTERVAVVAQRWRRHREGGGGSTERAALAAWRGRWQWHVEGGRMAWAACQCGWAAHWGCEVCTVGGAAALGWGLCVHQVCRHVSVRCIEVPLCALGVVGMLERLSLGPDEVSGIVNSTGMGNPLGFQSWVCWVWVWVSLLCPLQTHTHLAG